MNDKKYHRGNLFYHRGNHRRDPAELEPLL